MKTASKQDVRAHAKQRATRALKGAKLGRTDTPTSALRKLDKAMSKEFGRDYHTKLRPMGVTLSEKVKATNLKAKIPPVTGSGTIRCRTVIPPSDCSPDVDF